MNCRQAQEALLLRQSHELSGRAAAALKTHLANCSACREEERLLIMLVEVEQNTEHFGDVGQPTIDRILARAEEDMARPQSRGTKRPMLADFFDLWRPALIYGAAALLLALMTFHLLTNVPDQRLVEAPPAPIPSATEHDLVWDPDIDDTFDDLAWLLVYAIQDDSYEMQVNGETTLDELAAELLELEGWNI